MKTIKIENTTSNNEAFDDHTTTSQHFCGVSYFFLANFFSFVVFYHDEGSNSEGDNTKNPNFYPLKQLKSVWYY